MKQEINVLEIPFNQLWGWYHCYSKIDRTAKEANQRLTLSW
jgi:hypothetical protein